MSDRWSDGRRRGGLPPQPTCAAPTRATAGRRSRCCGAPRVPTSAQVAWATLWLAVAGLLEASGPIFGKHFIDEYLLPRTLDWRDDRAAARRLPRDRLARDAHPLLPARAPRRASRCARCGACARACTATCCGCRWRFFDRAITGQLVSRITNDTEAVKQLYTQVLFEMLRRADRALRRRRRDAVARLAADADRAAAGAGDHRRSSGATSGCRPPAVTRSRELRSDINAQMAEGIAGMSVLQASGAAARFADRFARTNDAHYAARMGEVRANAWLLRPALDFVNILLIVAIVAAVGTQRLQGVEVGLLYAFIAYVARVVEPLIQITMQFSLLQQSVIAAARVNTLLQEAAAPRGRARAAASSAGACELADVSFGYDPAQPVLHDITLPIPAGALHRHRRPHRQRQVDAAVAAAALLCAAGRTHRDRRHPARADRRRAFPRRRRAGAAGAVPAGRRRAREHRHGPRPARGGDRRGRPRGARARLHRSGSSRATTRRSAKAARGCRPDRSS